MNKVYKAGIGMVIAGIVSSPLVAQAEELDANILAPETHEVMIQETNIATDDFNYAFENAMAELNTLATAHKLTDTSEYSERLNNNLTTAVTELKGLANVSPEQQTKLLNKYMLENENVLKEIEKDIEIKESFVSEMEESKPSDIVESIVSEPVEEVIENVENKEPIEEIKTTTPIVESKPIVKPDTKPVVKEDTKPVVKEEVKVVKPKAKVVEPVKETPAVYSRAVSAPVNTPQTFINNISQSAKKLAAENDLYASVMIAQASLESNYGRSGLASSPNFNLFGIKGNYNGQSANMKTLEDNGKGQYYQINANFKKYPSYTQSLQDYVALINRGVSWNRGIYAGVKMSNTKSYMDATKALTGTYATDTAYFTKLNRIIQQYNLTQFDIENINDTISSKLPNTGADKVLYTVVSGDYLNKIASVFNTTTANLMAWNNLNSTVIHVGDTLTVGFKTTAKPETKPVVETTKPVFKEESKPVNKPAVKEEAKPVTQSKNTNYKVVSGDYLGKIANKYNTTVAQLKSLNGLKSDTIYVGQTLIVGKESVKPVTKPVTKPETKPVVETTKPVVKEESKPVNKPVVKEEAKPVTQSKNTNYKVVSGDYLGKIAKKYSITVSQLKTLNSLKSDTIYVGQTLIVGKESVKPVTKPVTKPVADKLTAKPQTTTSYKVVSGDYLGKIAKKYNTTVAQLKSLNGLKSDTIYVGQTLVVSKSTSNTTTPVKTTKTKSVKVVKGNTLSQLAKKHNTKVSILKAWNGLKSDIIYIGQTLIVNK